MPRQWTKPKEDEEPRVQISPLMVSLGAYWLLDEPTLPQRGKRGGPATIDALLCPHKAGPR